MKKYFKLIIVIVLILSFSYVKADCNDEDLNAWAVKVKPTFTKTSNLEDGKYGYSYFLSISPYREDVTIKVIDGKYSALGEKFGDFYGVGCYTNLEEKTYTIEVYGGENSKCKNELLKKMTYTVPMFNNMIKEDVCSENPDSEYCEPFTDKAKDMSKEEFIKAVKGDTKEEVKKEDNKLLKLISYALYIIIPFLIVTLIFIYRKNKFHKKEGKK